MFLRHSLPYGVHYDCRSAIMPKLINRPKIFILPHRTAIKVSNHMFSWSKNLIKTLDYVFDTLFTIWGTL